MVSRVDGHGGDEVILADIRAAQDGDADAYARIVKSWGGRLLRFCRNNLPATIDAEDVVQDVLLTAWQKLPGLDDRSRFRAWMYTIARNRCREVIRTAGRRATDPVSPEEVAVKIDSRQDPARAHARDAAMVALRKSVAGLPDSQRRIWVMAQIDGLGYAEIADIEELPLSTVRGRLARARATIAKEMELWR
ncbi:sigma-70 family RNA polymerase sigma factor [Cutibacterium acnes]|uniref:RNA polymerase sigma factor n=1 Tax=Cutibacterium acnes TaxID=1747 RepID=UPI0001F08C6C|nr:sigma-70 family RNA polymerase sigma factor [Cutibacterium acnes]OFK53759.1 RNA polymerase subunit sigma [Propionibacterium sp. HMSC069G10]EFT76366.1 Sigma-70 region 2 [Cutibacterium acnes HL050PA2]MBU5170191.1 sigma-70 family RNA polymerase sigma factor [Cutibacterium acnes]MCD1048106.1 sigma-70 family RNA polymerase sigma factor [Cutibacterium acnes]MCD1078350.1 sigma-70 family RNA polymerase sigma factor [Cutibacterium acnes]